MDEKMGNVHQKGATNILCYLRREGEMEKRGINELRVI